MRIGLDARILGGKRCGISQYLFNLIKQLVCIDNGIEIVLFSDKEILDEYKKLFTSKRIKVLVFGQEKKQRKKWAQFFLPKALKEQKIDLYHAVWNNAVPLKRSCPCVLTIHDLAPWILGGHFRNRYKELKYKIQHFICAHSADAVLTDSYASRKDISKLCRISEKKIKVVYLGADNDFADIKNDANLVSQALTRYNLYGKQYIIDNAGIDHPRRNVMLLVRAFADFVKKHKDFFLVLTGSYLADSAQHNILISAIKDYGIEDKVVLTGWVEDKVLFALISQAKISVIPSLYEGFCLPLLDAFSCGTPVVSTRCGSLAEIAADAAELLSDPYDPMILSRSIQKIIEDDNYREALIEKGKKRAKFFSWENTAKSTLDIYRNIYERKNT